MSAFILLFNRDQTPVDPATFSAMVATLNNRGPNGTHQVMMGHVAIAHHHHWVTPEEVGEEQPLSEGPFTLVCDGRVDNRAELLSQLGLPAATSDARLLLAGYQRWGRGLFARVIGPLVAAIYDERTQTLTLSRDLMGARLAYTHLSDTLFIAASEPRAIRAHPAVTHALDEVTIARFAAFRMAPGEGTFWRDIGEQTPATALEVTPGQHRTHTWWHPADMPAIRYKRDEDYAAHLREVFSEAVRARLRTVGKPALMMSGGYDSTSIAAVAAGVLTEPLTTLSWTFDGIPESDEREYIHAMNAHFGFDAHLMPADDQITLHQPERWWPYFVDWPDHNPFRPLVITAYHKAKHLGITTVMNGVWGNELFLPGWRFLAALLAEGKWKRLLRELRGFVKRHGVGGTFRHQNVHVMGWQALERLTRGRIDRITPRFTLPDWVTPHTRALISEAGLAENAPRLPDYGLLRSMNSWMTAHEYRLAHNVGVDARYPLFDSRVATFFLRLPAYQLADATTSKRLMKISMAGTLPERVRQAQSSGLVHPLLERGLYHHHYERAMRLLQHPDALWPTFIQPEPVFEELKLRPKRPSMVPWLAVTLEYWHTQFQSFAERMQSS